MSKENKYNSDSKVIISWPSVCSKQCLFIYLFFLRTELVILNLSESVRIPFPEICPLGGAVQGQDIDPCLLSIES